MGSYTYNPTAASNTSVDGIGAQGSDSPDNIDNLVRALAASDAALVRDLGGANTVAGTADAITVALADPTAATAYFDGMRFSFRAASDTTSTTPTLNVDTIGAKTIKKTIAGVESALVAGDIQAGGTYDVVYRSAWASAAGAFELLNPETINSTSITGPIVASSVNSGPLAGFRNHIINGAFMVAQRGTSFTSATTPANSDDTYLLDRWTLLADGADTVDVTQATDAPTGGLNSIGLDVETVNRKFGIIQFIEQKNCIGLIGNTVTLSFKARVSSLTKLDNVKAAIIAWSGTADSVTSDVVSAWGVEGTNPTLVANWTYENTPANLSVTTSWATYSVSAAVDTASAKNIAVFIWSDVTDTTLGDFLYITDVQLEQGSVATPFERRPHQTELELCKRYYQSYTDLGANTYGQNATGYILAFPLQVEMFAAPTPSFANISYNNCSTLANSSTNNKVLRVSTLVSSTAGTGVEFDVTLATEL